MDAPDDAMLGPRDLVSVSGPDAQRFLQSQISQDVDPLEVGDSVWTLVLTPAGKVVSLARVTRTDPDRFELDTDVGFGQALAERLGQFKIRVDAEISTTAGEREVLDPDGESRRVAARWPRLGAEITPGETVPAGLGLHDIAVSFTKGCYPGQELVERMDSRGSDAPQLLRTVSVAPGARPGDPVLSAEGEQIGVLTSVAGRQGLAWIRRGSADAAIDS